MACEGEALSDGGVSSRRAEGKAKTLQGRKYNIGDRSRRQRGGMCRQGKLVGRRRDHLRMPKIAAQTSAMNHTDT
jgi:hypothetical protein